MSSLVIRNFTKLTDLELLYILSLRNRDEIRQMMTNSELISKEDHLNFCHSLKDREDKKYYAIILDGTIVGVVTLNKKDNEDKSFYAGIYYADIDSSLYVHITGYLALLYEKLGIKTLYVFVKKDNIKALCYNAIKLGATFLNEDDNYVYFRFSNADNNLYVKREEVLRNSYKLDFAIDI